MINIITKHSSYNFGAMLQAYALQTTVKKLGADCKIINLRTQKKELMSSWKSPRGFINNVLTMFNKKDILSSYKKFEDFMATQYDLTDKYTSLNALKKQPTQAEVYIAGSDQVWNPLNIGDEFFLRFANKEKIIASYAASLGISYIPEGAKKIFKEYLNDFDYISVREEDAKNLLEKELGIKSQVNIDPVLLLDKDEWHKMAAQPKIKKPYILCYILYRPKWLNKWLKNLHKQSGLDIVLVSSDAYRHIYKNKIVRDAGPRELLGLIENAQCVITSSFHGTALSIATQKPFYAVVNPDMPSRIDNLLKTLGLQNRIVKENCNVDFSDIDYARVEELRIIQKEKSQEYLKEVIFNGRKKEKPQNIKEFQRGENISVIGDSCTGCTACANICPVGAIEMEENDEGFKYPHINSDKCTNCGLCLNKCHVVDEDKNTKENCKAYYGWHKDEKIRELSSSGGVFTAISDYVLKNNGVVIAAYFNQKEKRVIHASSDDIEFTKFRRSKYAESDIDASLVKIKEALNNNRMVLFCGTPCQCAGVRKYFGEEKNLIICDFLCHGVPSSKVFKEYLEHKEKKLKDTIQDYQFRTKTFGWSQHGINIKYEKHKEKNTVGRCEWFFLASMVYNMLLRKSCYTCNKAMYHKADITIGDFWGIYKYKPQINDNKGISCMLTNTNKGEEVLQKIKDSFEIFNLEKQYLEYAFKIKTHDKLIPKRNAMFEEYKSIGFEEFSKKHYRKQIALNKIIFKLKKHKYTKKGN